MSWQQDRENEAVKSEHALFNSSDGIGTNQCGFMLRVDHCKRLQLHKVTTAQPQPQKTTSGQPLRSFSSLVAREAIRFWNAQPELGERFPSRVGLRLRVPFLGRGR